jgi:hypothetical protein
VETETQQLRWEDKLIMATRKDLETAIRALRRAVNREEQLGIEGLANRLDLVKDELLSLV